MMMNLENNEPAVSQTPLIFAAGIVLIRLQLLEHAVKLCASFMDVEDKKATFENIFSDNPKQRHFTLGTLIKLLKTPTHFTESFNSQLTDFVHKRNKFIHKLWLENEIYSIDETVSNKAYLDISSFLDSLGEETIYMTRVFIGFNYSIGAHIARQEGKLEQFEVDPEFTGMKKYEPLFLSVVESE